MALNYDIPTLLNYADRFLKGEFNDNIFLRKIYDKLEGKSDLEKLTIVVRMLESNGVDTHKIRFKEEDLKQLGIEIPESLLNQVQNL